MELIEAAAWAMLTFNAGLFSGIWLTRKLSGPARAAATRPGFSWARDDIRFAEPHAKDTTVRLVTNPATASMDVEQRTFTFNILAADGIRRDMTYRASVIQRFFHLDGPRRREWRGDVAEYTRLLATAKHYGWVIPEGNGYIWAVWLGTRERRLRVLEAWLTSGR